MSNHKSDSGYNSITRGAFWASIAFYGLIALEFFYMVSPFAAYIYGVYGPGLEWLNQSGITRWLIGFFMPHIARETSSFFITWHETIGALFLVAGLAGFLTGAYQIYMSKLKRKGAVVGGVYRTIRHPQYLALMIASFGMLLIWPRYLVVFGFVTICFAYYLLARMEERICRQKFPGYAEYCEKTGMFLPHRFERTLFRFNLPSGQIKRAFSLAVFYLVSLLIAFGLARGIHIHSINSLYTYTTGKEVYLSIGRLSPETIENLAAIAASDPEVHERLREYSEETERFINYVMPVDIYVSEIPMYIPDGARTGHRLPSRENQGRYKIVYTIAEFGRDRTSSGLNILRHAVNKSAVIEVWLDRNRQSIERIIDPQRMDVYHGMPVPVF
jgi:protein-S-isoprenylcysteine O-methyltransferase Ste14